MACQVKNIRRVKVIVNNEIIEQVKTFKYLGYLITDIRQDEMDTPLINYNRINKIIKRNFGRQMRKDILLRFHNIVSKPPLLYGSECWVLAERMKFLPPSRDHIRNNYIRQQLKVENVIIEIKNFRQKLKGHLEIMPQVCLPKAAMGETQREEETLEDLERVGRINRSKSLSERGNQYSDLGKEEEVSRLETINNSV
ncbi:hypothetical protein L798_05477 [Zootermopsis nevadensis]|uniref:Uncharacterized protein n=1 Tax=Zootermopsis nevadensis TaxID=136037 RepID=A0A067R958_ZOONE|nr:hypothetical protein L798_05477 [Zootermopsis nevadensis]